MMISSIELIGIIGSAIVVIAMTAKTTTFVGTIFMRAVNLIGSAVFIAYGFLLPAYATAIMNILLLGINGFYIIKELVDHRKQIRGLN